MSEYYLNPFICWVHFFFKLFSCCVCKIRTITFLRFLIFLSISLSCIQTVNYMSAILKFYFIFYLAQQPPVGQGFLIHDVSRSHTTTRHSRQDSSGRVISSSQRPLPDKTQHSGQISMLLWDSNPQSQQASGHWDRQYFITSVKIQLDQSSMYLAATDYYILCV